MDNLKKMLGRKGKETDPIKKDAKLSALKDLRNVASSMMKDGISGKMNKVTVAAENPEDLKKGLDKAKQVVSSMPEKDDQDDADEKDESPEFEHMEQMLGEDSDEDGDEEGSSDHLDENEIDDMIKKLIEMKKKLQQK